MVFAPTLPFVVFAYLFGLPFMKRLFRVTQTVSGT